MGKHRWLIVALALLALVPAVAQGEPPRIVDFRLETPATTPVGAVGTPPAPAPLPNGQRLPQDNQGVFLVAAGLRFTLVVEATGGAGFDLATRGDSTNNPGGQGALHPALSVLTDAPFGTFDPAMTFPPGTGVNPGGNLGTLFNLNVMSAVSPAGNTILMAYIVAPVRFPQEGLTINLEARVTDLAGVQSQPARLTLRVVNPAEVAAALQVQAAGVPEIVAVRLETPATVGGAIASEANPAPAPNGQELPRQGQTFLVTAGERFTIVVQARGGAGFDTFTPGDPLNNPDGRGGRGAAISVFIDNNFGRFDPARAFVSPGTGVNAFGNIGTFFNFNVRTSTDASGVTTFAYVVDPERLPAAGTRVNLAIRVVDLAGTESEVVFLRLRVQ